MTRRTATTRRLARRNRSGRCLNVTRTITSAIRRQYPEAINRNGHFRTARRSAINSSGACVRERLCTSVMNGYLRRLARSNCRHDCRGRLRSSASAIKSNITRRQGSRVNRNRSGHGQRTRRSNKLRLDDGHRHQASARCLCNGEIIRAREDLRHLRVLL